MDKFLKLSFALALLAASFSVFYYHLVYLSRLEKEKLELQMQEMQLKTEKEKKETQEKAVLDEIDQSVGKSLPPSRWYPQALKGGIR